MSKCTHNIAVTVKLNSIEKATLGEPAKAAGVGLSAMMRELSLSGKVLPRPQINPIAIQQWQELLRVASNLNQAIALMNKGAVSGSAGRLEGVIQETLCELRAVHQNLIGLKSYGRSYCISLIIFKGDGLLLQAEQESSGYCI